MPVTLYVDEQFGAGIVARIAQEGTAIGAQAEAFAVRQPRASDPEQLYLAAQNGWTIPTRDRDFVALHDHWHVLQAWRLITPPHRHAGILYVESGQIADDDVVVMVLAFLSSRNLPPLEDRLYVLAAGGTWLSHHPFADALRRRLLR